MSKADRLWVIITPVVRPAVGGGAIYSDLLAKAFTRAGDDVLIVSEDYPDIPRHESIEVNGAVGHARILRLLPYRAGRAQRDWRSFVSYAQANLAYFRMPGLIREASRRGYGSVRILLHSSFFYNPGVMPAIIGWLRSTGIENTRLFLDVRDMDYPQQRLNLIGKFDAVVASSQGVAASLRQRTGLGERIAAIPMPFKSPKVPSPDTIPKTLESHGLTNCRFLLNPNGINTSKHYPVMREAMSLLRSRPGFEDVILVTVGRERDRSAADDAAETAGHARSLGPLLHENLLALMKSALATLIISKNEAISRAALEALAVGGRAVLPDVIEFRRDCEAYIGTPESPEALAARIVKVAALPPAPFDFSRHAEDVFMPMYRDLG